MELKKCLGCMEQFEGYPCPKCGFDPHQIQGLEYALPMETIVGGKYLIGRVLGQGGFGITYIGWDIALERKVAIKEYFPSGQLSRRPGGRKLTWYTGEQAVHAQKNGMEIFLKEARKMAKADSIPNVVRVLDLFTENETAYIVMDYVEGETLSAFLKKNGPIDWPRAVQIFAPVVHAMEQVHHAGIIHRDLSPDNLMLAKDGSVKILDLGAAKDLRLNIGASSMQVAKNGFSPMEQYVQRGGSGPWTDVYSIAATIYYSLTGMAPPNAVDRMNQDRISWDVPGFQMVPVAARKTLQQAMAIHPNDRPGSMQELARGLFDAEYPIKSDAPVKAEIPTELDNGIEIVSVENKTVQSQITKKPTDVQKPAKKLEHQTKKQKEKKLGKKNLILPLCAAVCCIACVFLLLGRKQPEKSKAALHNSETIQTEYTEPTQIHQTTAPKSAPSNKMAADVVRPVWDEENSRYKTLPVFGSKIMRDEIQSITFLSDLSSFGEDAWDISNKKDGSVMARLEKDGGMYDLYIGADGKVLAPSNCAYLFALYTNVRRISFGGNFDTSNTKSMEGMFQECHCLMDVDVNTLNTANVQDMTATFSNCEILKKLDLSSFDTSKVTDMSYMFCGCILLSELNLSNFNTTKVEYMHSMFANCASLTKLDVSSFTTRNVTKFASMFENCIGLTNLDLHSFFFRTTADTERIISGCVNLEQIQASNLWISDIRGKYADEAVELKNVTLHPFTLSTPLLGCGGMEISLYVKMNYGARCEDWEVWGKVNGAFTLLGTMKLPEGNGEVVQKVLFEKPVTVSEIVVIPSQPGSYSWSQGVAIEKALIGLT